MGRKKVAYLLSVSKVCVCMKVIVSFFMTRIKSIAVYTTANDYIVTAPITNAILSMRGGFTKPPPHSLPLIFGFAAVAGCVDADDAGFELFYAIVIMDW